MSNSIFASSTSNKPIRRRKLYEDVALRIEEMIRAGRFAPGDQLPSEKEIMEELAVGRSTVREAMLSLQKMGLATVKSGERARVTLPTAQVLIEELSGAARLLLVQEGGVQRFQEARALFEIGLARAAAQNATQSDIDRLRQALDANRDAVGSPAEFMRTDVAFHYVIATIPRNTIFTALYNAIVEWLTEQREISGRAQASAQLAYRAHERIFNAIAGQDPIEAQAAMQDHLNQVAKLYWQVRNSETDG